MANAGDIDPRVKQDMGKKLNAFNRVAKKAASKVAHMAQNNPMLAEALQTKAIPQANGHMGGMQIGKFSVFKIPNANNKIRYDVANETTGQKIIGDLHLAEAANSIAKLMNKGHSFYCPEIKQILEFESNYVKNYNDAVSFKKKITNNPVRDAIMETRFEESKLKASEAKQKLIEYTKKI